MPANRLPELVEALAAVHRRAADTRYAAAQARGRPSAKAQAVQLSQLRALEHELAELHELARAVGQQLAPKRSRRAAPRSRAATQRRRSA